MTDPRPEYDPEEIRGAARSDPQPETEEVLDGDSVAGNYPTHADGRERANTCATCWQQIPKGRIKCPHCASNDISESSPSDGDRTVQQWSFGRVVVAVVPGNSTYHARALGASAFEVSDSVATGPDVSHGEVKLRAAFETVPASHLTDGWPDLPPEAPVAEPDGTTLFETAVEETDWDGVGEPRIYREDGRPVTTRGELESLRAEIDAAEEQHWVVPGIVQRHAASPDPEDIDEPLYCVGCAAITGHDAVGKDGFEGYSHYRRTIWACRSCGQPRHEPERDSDSSESVGYEHLLDDISPGEIHSNEPDFQEREFHTQINQTAPGKIELAIRTEKPPIAPLSDYTSENVALNVPRLILLQSKWRPFRITRTVSPLLTESLVLPENEKLPSTPSSTNRCRSPFTSIYASAADQNHEWCPS